MVSWRPHDVFYSSKIYHAFRICFAFMLLSVTLRTFFILSPLPRLLVVCLHVHTDFQISVALCETKNLNMNYQIYSITPPSICFSFFLFFCLRILYTNLKRCIHQPSGATVKFNSAKPSSPLYFA